MSFLASLVKAVLLGLLGSVFLIWLIGCAPNALDMCEAIAAGRDYKLRHGHSPTEGFVSLCEIRPAEAVKPDLRG